jgi:Ni/Fe-hydrogenase subunit HybB-like protein
MTAIVRNVRHELTRDPVFSMWLVVLGVLLLIGLTAGINVFVYGLGVTNLSNEVPWGLWITVDLSAIALGAGAFSLSALVYI